MTVVIIAEVEIVGTRVLVHYALPELPPFFRIPRRTHIKESIVEKQFDPCQTPLIDTGTYHLCRVIKNDWGKIEAGWYKLNPSSPRHSG